MFLFLPNLLKRKNFEAPFFNQVAI